jgi:hypothetical protein
MLKFTGIYRKLLVLAVLSGSLFVFSSSNSASASIICCTEVQAYCDQLYGYCALDCNVDLGIPAKYAECIAACESSRLTCLGFCDLGC